MPHANKIVFSLVASALVSAPLAAQQQRQRVSPECRQEIVQLCAQDGARDRTKIRACVREKFGELSQACAAEIQARMQNRQPANKADENAETAPPTN